MLSFVSPWWALATLSAIGLPLAAHLLSRARYREAWFPATRLVQQAVLATARVERPRQLLLMLLRTLVLLLLVAAFMRPLWTPPEQGKTPHQGVCLVVLLDASASMRRADRGTPLYDQARQQVGTLLAGLDPARDVAAVVRVDRSPNLLLPEPTGRIGTLQERLSTSAPGFESANWPDALALAGRLARGSERALRVVVVSDQQGAWPKTAAGDSGLGGVPIDFIRLESAANDNTSVRFIDLRPYPPVAGRPVTATAELSHFDPQPRRIALTASIGDSTTRRSITLAPYSTQRIGLDLPGPAPGPATFRIAIDGVDVIAGDDVAAAVFDVQRAARVLVAYHAPGDAALARRLALTLNPGGAGGLSLPDVQLASWQEAVGIVRQADPSDLRTVVVAGGEQPGALSSALEAYGRRGGGVVRFVGGADGPVPPAFAAGADFSVAPLRVFEGPARGGLTRLPWPGVGFQPIAEGQTPLLRAADGRVIVSSQLRGRGRVVTVNAALSGGPGGLLAQPAFVVLFNELCRYASPGAALPAAYRPGDALPQAFAQAPPLSLPAHADRGSAAFSAPGLYRASDGSAAWVELDPTESDTTASAAWAGPDASGPASRRLTGDTSTLAASIRPQPLELWPYLLAAALFIAGFESWLLWRFAGRQGAGP